MEIHKTILVYMTIHLFSVINFYLQIPFNNSSLIKILKIYCRERFKYPGVRVNYLNANTCLIYEISFNMFCLGKY